MVKMMHFTSDNALVRVQSAMSWYEIEIDEGELKEQVRCRPGGDDGEEEERSSYPEEELSTRISNKDYWFSKILFALLGRILL